MALTGMLFPPAGAGPIVVIFAASSWPFLFAPVLVGTICIVWLGVDFHRWVTRANPHQSEREVCRPFYWAGRSRNDLVLLRRISCGRHAWRYMTEVQIHCANKSDRITTGNIFTFPLFLTAPFDMEFYD